MTALADILRRQIAAQGPITVADYMAQCLLHPRHGYYTTRDPLGAEGDFTTAPEISQMFGEVLGLLMAQVWMDQGAPAPFTLAELGPGRGTLMADMLRATARVPGFHDGLSLHLVEVSDVLRRAQAARLPQATWHDTADTLPQDVPLFVVANEFFDALPIRQFLRHPKGWAERVVGLADGRLTFGLTPPAPLAALDPLLGSTAEGAMVETCAPALPVIDAISTRIGAQGGAALIVDYGEWGSTGDTLQAIYRREKDHPLAHPGQADLTAHVDFRALAQASTLQATPLTPQGTLLLRLGLAQRADTLARKLSGPALDSHIAAYRRLTDPSEMGQLFKVMGLSPSGAPALPGFG